MRVSEGGGRGGGGGKRDEGEGGGRVGGCGERGEVVRDDDCEGQYAHHVP